MMVDIDLFGILRQVQDAAWWLLPIVVVFSLLNTPAIKGRIGELVVRLWAKLFLRGDRYHSFHSIILPTPDGTTEIDHIFVSRYGIFVVETKNRKGWIYGDEKQREWTQVIHGKKYRFQNPLYQNYKHVKALESALNIPTSSIHSVVVFTGSSRFKTRMPENVVGGLRYVSYIKSFKDIVLTDAQVQEAVQLLESRCLATSAATRLRHVQRLKSRSNPKARRRCPRCGGEMVLRTAKRGTNAGTRFWGCSKYPKCKQVQRFETSS